MSLGLQFLSSYENSSLSNNSSNVALGLFRISWIDEGFKEPKWTKIVIKHENCTRNEHSTIFGHSRRFVVRLLLKFLNLIYFQNDLESKEFYSYKLD